MEEYLALVDRMHEAHLVSPSQQPHTPACLCAISATAPTDQPNSSAESHSLHVLQQQAAVAAGARCNPPLAPVPPSTEARLVSVEASPTPTDADVCFFHRCFGDEARNCRLPCPWPHQENRVGKGH
ncbi:hypothetical protein E2C01_050568 [Portunus trituberculatus]|uniref:Uncharacterized protein n=1 Tax=Portunus trituberculatus TaxID=210409 RepID=A0A5B7GJC5_PORTR|nr:hypothetical protein [Portunus trituberculatus]